MTSAQAIELFTDSKNFSSFFLAICIEWECDSPFNFGPIHEQNFVTLFLFYNTKSG